MLKLRTRERIPFVSVRGGGSGRVYAYLETPMFRTLPFSTISSSFFHVGNGSAVRASSRTLSVPFLKATGLCMHFF